MRVRGRASALDPAGRCARSGKRIRSFGPACGIRMPSANSRPMAHGSHGALWSECPRPTWTPTCVDRDSHLCEPGVDQRARGEHARVRHRILGGLTREPQ